MYLTALVLTILIAIWSATYEARRRAEEATNRHA